LIGRFLFVKIYRRADIPLVFRYRMNKEDIMHIVHSSEIPSIPNWAHQLAELTRLAWTGTDGRCYFPYFPLTTEREWATHVLAQWMEGSMHSWVGVVDGRIVNHAALVNNGTHWELGRLVSHCAPSGGTLELCRHRLAWCRARNIHARMECTQAHTRAQELAAAVGLRFAGLGFLDQIDGVDWDIVFFDTLDRATEFVPRAGLLANPLGVEHPCIERDRTRLRQIRGILSTDRGGPLPPQQFHVLPRLRPVVEKIIGLNT
jgi:hypothetical protein